MSGAGICYWGHQYGAAADYHAGRCSRRMYDVRVYATIERRLCRMA